MHEPTYRQALSSAWQLVWRHKSLWILGLLAIFIGHLGVSNFIGYIWAIADRGLQDPAVFSLPQMVINLPERAWASVALALWLGGILVTLGVMIVFLGIAAQGAMIAYAGDWFKRGRANMAKAWQKGVKHFWRVLGVELIEKLLLGALLLLFGFALRMFLASGTTMSVVFFTLALALVVFVGLAIVAITIYALGYIVIEEEGMVDALMKGASLFWRHILVSAEVSLILMVVDTVLLPVVGAGVFLAFLPSLAIWITAGFANNAALMGIGLIVGLFLWTIFIILAGAIFNAFATNAWVYLFMKMHKEGVASRVLHWFGKAIRRANVG